MTHRLGAGSPHAGHAVRFGAELARAMESRPGVETELAVVAHERTVAHQRWRAAGGTEALVHGPSAGSTARAAHEAFLHGLAISDAIAAEQRRATRR